jgi:hypothetical protein
MLCCFADSVEIPTTPTTPLPSSATVAQFGLVELVQPSYSDAQRERAAALSSWIK